MNPKIQKFLKPILVVLTLLYLWALYRTAWLSDDAYITYRSVENFVKGYGMTFNPGQRVQAFTHPLWAFLHIPFRFLFRNMYGIGLFVGMGVSIASILLLAWKHFRRMEIRIFAMVAIISSAAFIDYNTSGLENPLTHLLLALCTWVYLDDKFVSKRLLFLSFLTGLVLLNRMDTILMAGPILFVCWWKQRNWRSVGIVFIGILPFILWEILAIIYYGFPFPMSAYAKLNISVERGDLLIQGIMYFLDIIREDPATAFIILGGITIPFFTKKENLYPISAGVILYLLYVGYIGGDFMRGRFFTAPFFLSLIVWGQGLSLIPGRVWYMTPFIALLGFLGSAPPLIVSDKYLFNESEKITLQQTRGITNERAYYFQGTGLSNAKNRTLPDNTWVDRGKSIKNSPLKYFVSGNMGFIGYYAGPEKHIIDRYALTDPFLAQLPNVYQPDWRPGHNQRLIPRGYTNSLMSGENQLVSPQLKEVFEAINLITRGPIWSKGRFETIWRMNATSYYSNLIDDKFYYLPVAVTIHESELSNINQQAILAHADAGLEIQLEKRRKINQFALQIQRNCSFVCVMAKGDKIISGKVLTETSEDETLRGLRVPVPEEEIDRIILYPNTHFYGCKMMGITIQ